MADKARWVPAYIGLGANLGEPAATVAAAFEALEEIDQTRLVLRSARYRNPPMGPADQPDYINAVAALVTRLAPHALLEALQQIEQDFGRDRSGPAWGARTLDLDLLVFGGLRIDDGTLRVPHPGLHQRNFVLYPLAEIAPQLCVPGLGRVQELTAAVTGDDLEVWEQGM